MIVDNLFQTLVSLGKMAIKSRPNKRANSSVNHERILVLGNGPSAKSLIEKAENKPLKASLMAVNKFAIDATFFRLKPSFYLLHDGDFFHFTEEIWNNPSLRPRVKTKPEFEVWQDQINNTWKNLQNLS